MESIIKAAPLFLGILLTGLSAGLFYAWEVSVIPGTKLITDRNYLETMQSINRAILNPGFYLIFFGSLLLLFTSTYLQYRVGVNLSFWLLLGASISYLVGTFGVTVFGNVPLNEALGVLNLQELTDGLLDHHRSSFEDHWNRLHTVRTVFSILAFVAILLSSFLKSNQYQ